MAFQQTLGPVPYDQYQDVAAEREANQAILGSRSATAEAIGKVVGAGTAIYGEAKKAQAQAEGQASVQKLQENISDTAETVRTIEGIKQNLEDQGLDANAVAAKMQQVASFDPTKQSQIPGLNLPDELNQKLTRVKMRAARAFNTIASGVAQGAMSQDVAALHMEATLKQLTNETPGFGPELRQTARELLGYDPTGYDIRQILSLRQPKEVSPKKTKMDEYQQEAEARHAMLGAASPGIPAILSNMAQSKMDEEKKVHNELMVQSGNMDFNSYAYQTSNAGADDIGNLLGQMALIRKNGGEPDPQNMADKVQQLIGAKKADLARVAAQKGGVSPSSLQDAYKVVDENFAPLLDSVKNSSSLKLMTDNLDKTMKLAATYGHTLFPDATLLNDTFGAGSPIPGQIYAAMATATTPEQQSMLIKSSPVLSAMWQKGELNPQGLVKGLMPAMRKMLSGEQLTPEDMKFQPAAEKMIVSQPGNSPLKQEYTKKLMEHAPTAGVQVLSSIPRTQWTPEQLNTVQKVFKQNMTQTIPGIPNKIEKAAENIPKSEVNWLHLRSDGTVSFAPYVKYQGKLVETGISTVAPDASLDHLNMFLKLVDKTNDGDLEGVNKKTYPAEVLNKIKEIVTGRNKEVTPSDLMTGEVKR